MMLGFRDDYRAAAPAPAGGEPPCATGSAATCRRSSLALMPNARPWCRSVGPLSLRSGDRWTDDVAPGDAVLFAQPLCRSDGVGALALVLAFTLLTTTSARSACQRS